MVIWRNESIRQHIKGKAPGEVLGIAGLVGSGRTELLKLIAGIDSKTSGSVSVDGAQIHHLNVTSAIKAGIGLQGERMSV